MSSPDLNLRLIYRVEVHNVFGQYSKKAPTLTGPVGASPNLSSRMGRKLSDPPGQGLGRRLLEPRPKWSMPRRVMSPKVFNSLCPSAQFGVRSGGRAPMPNEPTALKGTGCDTH